MISATDSGWSGPGWARHFTLIVPHSTLVHKQVLANLLLGGEGVPCDGLL